MSKSPGFLRGFFPSRFGRQGESRMTLTVEELLKSQLHLLPFLPLYFRARIVAGAAGYDGRGGLLALPSAGLAELVGVIISFRHKHCSPTWTAFRVITYNSSESKTSITDNPYLWK
jgi:hypothetical protein